MVMMFKKKEFWMVSVAWRKRDFLKLYHHPRPIFILTFLFCFPSSLYIQSLDDAFYLSFIQLWETWSQFVFNTKLVTNQYSIPRRHCILRCVYFQVHVLFLSVNVSRMEFVNVYLARLVCGTNEITIFGYY